MGTNRIYRRSRMKYYLMMDIGMWFAMKEGFKVPVNNNREICEYEVGLINKKESTCKYQGANYTTMWVSARPTQQSRLFQECKEIMKKPI